MRAAAVDGAEIVKAVEVCCICKAIDFVSEQNCELRGKQEKSGVTHCGMRYMTLHLVVGD